MGISIWCQVIGMMWRGMNGRLSGSAQKCHRTDKCEIKLGDDDAEGYQVLQGVSILIVPGPFGRVYCDAARGIEKHVNRGSSRVLGRGLNKTTVVYNLRNGARGRV